MKRIWISVAQLALVVAIVASFFSLTVWVGCRPLAELNPGQRGSMPIPQDAACFTDNHGQIAFHAHGLISQEPVRFAISVAGVLIPWFLLLSTFLLVKNKGPRVGGRAGEK